MALSDITRPCGVKPGSPGQARRRIRQLDCAFAQCFVSETTHSVRGRTMAEREDPRHADQGFAIDVLFVTVRSATVQERSMKRVLTACAVIGLCASVRLFAQSEAGYRANIGKMAVSAADGKEIGRIVDVAMMNGRSGVYKVQREGKIISSPVESIVAKVPPKPVKTPEATKPVKAPEAVEAEGNIDPLLQRTANAFREELTRHQSTLQALVITPKGISAKWSSAKCELLRVGADRSALEHQADAEGFACHHSARTPVAGRVRPFTVTGETFHRYRTGEIDEARVLAAVKYRRLG